MTESFSQLYLKCHTMRSKMRCLSNVIECERNCVVVLFVTCVLGHMSRFWDGLRTLKHRSSRSGSWPSDINKRSSITMMPLFSSLFNLTIKSLVRPLPIRRPRLRILYNTSLIQWAVIIIGRGILPIRPPHRRINEVTLHRFAPPFTTTSSDRS